MLLAELSDQEARQLEYDWRFWARPSQLPPAGRWFVWLLRAGRGFGKTRTGAEYVRDRIEHGHWRRVALVARSAADARDTVVEGESGILAICPPWNRPHYEPSKRRLTWPNGALATLYSADEPDQLRGPQHDGAWADELASWRHLKDAWSNLMFGLRLGADPRAVVTTTPRPLSFLQELLARPTTVVTRGSSYDNFENLASAFISEAIAPYEGTRLGRQEIEGELIEDVEGALWSRDLIEAGRVITAPEGLRRVVVGVDPTGGQAEAGIVAAGMDSRVPPHFYVLEDRSQRASPHGWGRAALDVLDWHQGDRIVAEGNYGGAMVESTLRTIDPNAPVEMVQATRGKLVRAEPIVSLYEQRRVHHVGAFPKLEDEQCSYAGAPGDASPNRLDALVWALTDLAKPKRRMRAL